MFLKNKLVLKKPNEVFEGEEKLNLQKENMSWWENNPMQYDWTSPLNLNTDSQKYFEEIDRRMFLGHPLQTEKIPFDMVIDYDYIRGKRLLEIGVGLGSHAALLSKFGGEYYGIDITENAVERTKKRLEALGLNGIITRMDAENMVFPDNKFDYVYSWGVIHHSSDTIQCLKEIIRVLRPGGKCTFMVYNRSFWVWYIQIALWNGLLQKNILKHRTLNIAKLSQISTDGFLARYFRKSELIKILNELNVNEISIKVSGNPLELIPLPKSYLKDKLVRLLPLSLARFILEAMAQGSLLIVNFSKR